MEKNDDEGDQATFAILRPCLLSLILLACTQHTHESKTQLTHLPKIPEASTSVLAKAPPPKKKKKKKIYLTFDDGPNRGTSKVLHIIQEEQVPVTFFIVGEHVFASTSQHAVWDSLKIDTAIELCNHSHTHAHDHYERFYKNVEGVVSDFKRCQDSLQLTNNIARAPGRNIWRVDTLSFTDLHKSAAAADSLQQAGFAIIGWDLEWHYDHKTFTLLNKSDDLLQQIDSLFAHNKTRVPENLVLLAHDQVYYDENDSSELHQLIKKLKARADYELEIVSNYPGMKQPK
jgi:peptidoglycan/xylan/chitin deacetylase (PgdA/CDA1 family)